MTRKLSLPQVTRVEVIDSSGRAFTRRYDTAGASVHVQDDGATIKVFATESQEPAASGQKPPFTALRDAVSDGLNSAHEFLGEPATAGAALDAVIDRVRGAFTGDADAENADETPSTVYPTREELYQLVADAVEKGQQLSENPEFGGTVEDVIVDDLLALFAAKGA